MLRSTELKVQMSAKYEELKKLQQAKDWERGSKLADELNTELAMEKAKFENFMQDATPLGGNVSNKVSRGIIGTKDYRNAFFNAVRSNFRNGVEPILNEGADVAGGFLVPAEMHDTISEKLADENVMRQICTVIQTKSVHRMPILSSKPQAAWTLEKTKIDLSDESFSQITLDAYKLSVGVKVSNELLTDSHYNLEEHFVGQFVQTIGNSEEDAFINGTGQNQPTGFLTELKDDSDCCVSTIETTPAGQFTTDDLLKLVYSLRRPYRKNAVFVMHDSTLHLLRYLKDDTRNYIWQPSNIAGEPDKLFGSPIVTSAFFPTVKGTGNEIVAAYGDFSRYYIAERGQRLFRPLREVFALEDCSAFLMLERIDGKLIDKDAIRLLKTK